MTGRREDGMTGRREDRMISVFFVLFVLLSRESLFFRARFWRSMDSMDWMDSVDLVAGPSPKPRKLSQNVQ